jgi:hypothetical protein
VPPAQKKDDPPRATLLLFAGPLAWLFEAQVIELGQ